MAPGWSFARTVVLHSPMRTSHLFIRYSVFLVGRRRIVTRRTMSYRPAGTGAAGAVAGFAAGGTGLGAGAAGFAGATGFASGFAAACPGIGAGFGSSLTFTVGGDWCTVR